MNRGIDKMSNSTEKMEVSVSEMAFDGEVKKWVKVRLKRSRTFLPSFEDLHRIIQAISYCEDLKYPNGEGRDKASKFMADCPYYDFETLAKKYNIPIRQGREVVNPNGAKLK